MLFFSFPLFVCLMFVCNFAFLYLFPDVFLCSSLVLLCVSLILLCCSFIFSVLLPVKLSRVLFSLNRLYLTVVSLIIVCSSNVLRKSDERRAGRKAGRSL